MLKQIQVGLLATAIIVWVYIIATSPALNLAAVAAVLKCLADITGIIGNNRQK